MVISMTLKAANEAELPVYKCNRIIWPVLQCLRKIPLESGFRTSSIRSECVMNDFGIHIFSRIGFDKEVFPVEFFQYIPFFKILTVKSVSIFFRSVLQ